MSTYDAYNNVLRSLTSLEKSLDRLARSNYLNRNQYPNILLQLESALSSLREWIKHYRKYDELGNFYVLLAQFIGEIGGIISQLWITLKSVPGKRKKSKADKINAQEKISEMIELMLDRTSEFLDTLKDNNSLMAEGLDEALAALFEREVVKPFCEQIEQIKANVVSQRGEKTYIFPCADIDAYLDVINDPGRFRNEVINKLHERYQTGHKPSCHCHGKKKYRLCGFRKNARKTITSAGKKEIFPIRMIECSDCGQRFSLLPSFLPREKHYGMDIIENVCRNLFLFHQSLQGTLENNKLIGKNHIKSKQTIYNWVRWVGTKHPATILTAAGVKGSGYFQEDEGFEKEPNLRTYTVVIVDPESHLVWHVDYLDHVDEETLHSSFEEFMKRISFKVLEVTKDKWQASTNALKRVFYKIWIGYCHRHCLKKFLEVLTEYQKETKCSQVEVKQLYKKFKGVLKTSTSAINLKAQIRNLDDEAFTHPLLQKRLEELRDNAEHYTAHKNRRGITETTSIVDNYLKIVKRKLRQVESFRDKYWTRLFFRAQANTRNFIPYNPGAKNAHKSPFMLAGGYSYDLPGFQAMNVHNAFLFADGIM